MTAEETIRSFLKRNAGQSYCDDCLSSSLAIKPRQQVQQKTFRIAQEPFFERRGGFCPKCKSEKLVISYRQTG